jgi:hypothetical protein
MHGAELSISENAGSAEYQLGTYLSANLIVIADADDADWPTLQAAGAAPGTPNRMLLRALEGQVTASYYYKSVGLTKYATVGKDIKILYVDVAEMLDENGNETAGEERIQKDMIAMQERFAQANIEVIWTYHPTSFAPPSSIAAAPASWVAYTIDSSTNFCLTAEAREVIGASGLGTNNFRIIYVPGETRGHDLRTGTTSSGIGAAFSALRFTNNTDRAYTDTCFVESKPNRYYTATHEILHLLGLKHVSEIWNLVYGMTTEGKCLHGRKRLTQKQVDDIRKDMRSKLK